MSYVPGGGVCIEKLIKTFPGYTSMLSTRMMILFIRLIFFLSFSLYMPTYNVQIRVDLSIVLVLHSGRV